MKRFLHNHNEQNAEINLTPMLDVIFIMLIFFIVSTSFVKESGIKVDLPAAQTSKTKIDTNLIVAIKDQEIWLEKKLVNLHYLSTAIMEIKTQNVKNTALIQADKTSTAELIVKVMDSIRLAGINNITLATKKE